MSATWTAAHSVEEAVAAMVAGARPVAGGTDLVVRARSGRAPLPAALVGLGRLAELRSIDPLAGGLRLGALATHGELLTHPDVLARYTGLADAAAGVGSVATRANGTIGGNVMNASPAMDTGAPLLCHGALAVLHGPREVRRVPLEALWTGPGTVSASPHELLVALELPPPAPSVVTGSAYVRLQYRRQMEIAVVGAAAVIGLSGGRVVSAQVAVSALAPVVHRVPDAEDLLLDTDGGDGPARRAGDAVAAVVDPIDDVRASARYRRATAAVVVRRAVRAAVRRALGDPVPVPAGEARSCEEVR